MAQEGEGVGGRMAADGMYVTMGPKWRIGKGEGPWVGRWYACRMQIWLNRMTFRTFATHKEALEYVRARDRGKGHSGI